MTPTKQFHVARGIPVFPADMRGNDLFPDESEYTPCDYPALSDEQISTFLNFERAYDVEQQATPARDAWPDGYGPFDLDADDATH